MGRIKSIKERLLKIKPITSWDDIQVGDVYHVPPIMNLKRRDFKILTKTNDEITYKRLDDEKNKESRFANHSIFARFLVKEKKW